jgi:predicted phage-related endonuclease
MPKLTSDTMLSCSQLPAIMGHSKWASANDTLSFCMKSIQGEDARTPAGEAADWGNALEESIIKEMVKRLGLEHYTMPEEAFNHPELPLAASADAIAITPLDGLVIKNDPSKGIYVVGADEIILTGSGVLESKLTRMGPEDTLPLYRGPIQVQGVMMCTGLRWAAIGCLYSGVELRIYLFSPHTATMDAIHAAAIDFESRLENFRQTGEPAWYPPQDSKDADRVWPNAKDEDIDLGDEIEGVASAIVGLKHQIKDMEEQISEKEVKLKTMMQEFSSAKCGKWSIKWPMRHFKAQPEKVTPAKEAYSIRQSTLTIKEAK